MKTLKPAYYDDFYCLADKCDYTCCMDWGIHLNPEEAARYRTLADGAYASYITEDERGARICFNEDGLCPMLTDNGLCSLVLKHGMDSISNICDDYPRFVTEYSNQQEYHLSNGCREVLSYFLKTPVPMRFAWGEAESFPRADKRDFSDRMMRARWDAVALMQLSELPIWIRVFILRKYALDSHDFSKDYDDVQKKYFRGDTILGIYQSLQAVPDNLSMKLSMLHQLITDFNESAKGKRAYRMHIEMLQDELARLVGGDVDEVMSSWDDFNSEMEKFRDFFEHFCVNYLYTHVEVICEQGMFADAMTVLMLELALIKGTLFLAWRHEGRKLSETRLLHISSYYARMIEHSIMVHIEFVRNNDSHPWFTDAGYLYLLR